jgi:hypothetical protein
MDLRVVMDRLMTQIVWDPVVPINENLTVFIRPLNYKQLSGAALQTFETQKIMQVVNDDSTSEDTKVKLFKESFKKLSDSTMATIADSIAKIESIGGSTDDPAHIREFVDNADKEIFKKIQSRIEELRDINTIKPMSVQVTDEMRAQGIEGDVINVPITFDPSTFFV